MLMNENPSPDTGPLDGVTRELLALTVDVREGDAQRIATRVAVLTRLGANRHDVQEALGVAVLKGGRRALRHAIDALAAFDRIRAREKALEAA